MKKFTPEQEAMSPLLQGYVAGELLRAKNDPLQKFLAIDKVDIDTDADGTYVPEIVVTFRSGVGVKITFEVVDPEDTDVRRAIQSIQGG